MSLLKLGEREGQKNAWAQLPEWATVAQLASVASNAY